MRIATLSMVVCGLFVCGCGQFPNRPARWASLLNGPIDVRLELELSSSEGAPEQPITLTAIAQNRGKQAIVYWPPMCLGPDMGFELLGPGGERLGLSDPCAPVALCDFGYTVLRPGQSVRVPLEFAGPVYRVIEEDPRQCQLVQATPGEYAITARFLYAPISSGLMQTLEEETCFRWTAE